MGGEHGLVVLLFVLRDHREGEPVVLESTSPEPARIQHVPRLVPDLTDVLPGFVRAEEREGRAGGPGVFEGVVQFVDVAADRVPPTHIADQPEFLLVADVREIPDERAHQRRMLGDQIRVVDAIREGVAAMPGPQ